MVTYSSKYVEQLVDERDLLNRKLKQQSDDLRKLVEEWELVKEVSNSTYTKRCIRDVKKLIGDKDAVDTSE